MAASVPKDPQLMAMRSAKKAAGGYKAGEVVEVEVVSKRPVKKFIPARLTKINDDGTVNLSVINAKTFGVNPLAVHVPVKYLRKPVKMGVGSRVVLEPGYKVGTIMFKGQHKVLGAGEWVGIALDKKRGFCDGTWKGVQFFHCARWHGMVVPVDRVTKILVPVEKQKSPAPAAVKSRKAPPQEEKKEEMAVPAEMRLAPPGSGPSLKIKAEADEMYDMASRADKRPLTPEPPSGPLIDYRRDPPKSPITKGDLKGSFNMFDINKDGRITTSEMTKVMKNLGSPLDDEDVIWLVNEFDTNNNGTIEWSEFVKMMEEIGGLLPSTAFPEQTDAK